VGIAAGILAGVDEQSAAMKNPTPRAARRACGLALILFGVAAAQAQTPLASIDWQRVGDFSIARTETTIGQFKRFVQATGTVTQAERNGGGEVYESGWVRKPGWTWRTPFGQPHAATDDEPAVHVTFDEAQAFCRWAGGALPTDAQWVSAAYTEQRAAPAPPFKPGQRYAYPTGDTPGGAQCLDDCGPAAQDRAVRHGARLWRGHGHARVSTTPAGVNGLHDMGGNAWEWVDEPESGSGERKSSSGERKGGSDERRTRGGSWWYGAGQMRADRLQAKPRSTAVVYIGFRCVRPG
jgi:formylglycine-generating enzyme required for sulfatase activity